MKKIIIFGLFFALLAFISAHSFAKVQIKQKSKPKQTASQKIELKKAVLQLSTAKPSQAASNTSMKSSAPSSAQIVITQKIEPPKIIAAQTTTYPRSSMNRDIVVPQGTREALGSFEYRYLSESHLGTNVYLQGRYGHFENWEFLGDVSVFPQTQVGVEFGGIRAGFLYKALSENETNPDLGLGLKIGLLGKGIYSLTKDNDFALMPNIIAKKQIADRLSMIGELMLGVGNNEAGIASVSTTGIYKTTQDIDTRLKLDLENLGYTFDQILSITPTVEYHWDQNTDVMGGTHLGLVGTSYLGNNFFVGLSKRF